MKHPDVRGIEAKQGHWLANRVTSYYKLLRVAIMNCCLAGGLMAHLSGPSAYGALTRRLNRFPQGAPASDLLYKILSMLLSDKEAALMALLPIRPFTTGKAAKAWKIGLKAAQNMLDQVADRAILVDVQQEGQTLYFLPPPMAGFFEFSLMRLRNDVNRKVLSELYYQYINVEEDFIKALFVDVETSLGRVLVKNRLFRSEPDCTCSIMNEPPRSSGAPRPSASACATAATR